MLALLALILYLLVKDRHRILLATVGARQGDVQRLYTDLLLMLSAWVSPWFGVVIADWWAQRASIPDPRLAFSAKSPIKVGLIAWALGLIASLPFFNQAWFVGPVVRRNPHIGDISYYVGFAVAALSMVVLLRFTHRQTAG